MNGNVAILRTEIKKLEHTNIHGLFDKAGYITVNWQEKSSIVDLGLTTNWLLQINYCIKYIV